MNNCAKHCLKLLAKLPLRPLNQKFYTLLGGGLKTVKNVKKAKKEKGGQLVLPETTSEKFWRKTATHNSEFEFQNLNSTHNSELKILGPLRGGSGNIQKSSKDVKIGCGLAQQV